MKPSDHCFNPVPLLIVGNVSIDTISIGSITTTVPGGGGLHMATAAQLTGANPLLMATVGSDFRDEDFGTLARAMICTRAGPTARFDLVYDRMQALVSISSEFGVSTPGRPWLPRYQRILHAHLSSKAPLAPEKLAPKILARAFSSDVSISSLSSRSESLRGLLPYLSFLFLNQTEYTVLQKMIDLSSFSRMLFIVSYAGEGVRVWRSNKLVASLPAFPVSVVDPTGAGDVLAGGTLGMVVQGVPLIPALAAGCALASCCVEGWGSGQLWLTPRDVWEDRAEHIFERAAVYDEL